MLLSHKSRLVFKKPLLKPMMTQFINHHTNHDSENNKVTGPGVMLYDVIKYGQYWSGNGSCLSKTSHYLNQCRLIISEILWHTFPGGGGGALPLWVSVGMRRGFASPFSASGRSFCPPKFDHVYHFIQILLGPISKPPNFQHVDDLFAPKIDQIYNFIQILLGPISNFEPRTPTDFYPECPPPGHTFEDNVTCSPFY